MNQPEKAVAVPDKIVMREIYVIRDQKVIPDRRDLTELHGVEAKYFIRVARKNISRLPNETIYNLFWFLCFTTPLTIFPKRRSFSRRSATVDSKCAFSRFIFRKLS